MWKIKQKIWPIVKRKRVKRNWPQDDHMLELADKNVKAAQRKCGYNEETNEESQKSNRNFKKEHIWFQS